MKVLHVLNEIKHSGAELMLHSSYPSFKKRGVFFVALATGKHKGSFAEEFEIIGIPVVHKPLVKNAKLPLQFLPYFFHYYRFLRKEKFDVVHIHRMYLYFWYAFFAKLAGVRVILRTVHNVFRPGRLRYVQFYLSRKILSPLGVVFTSIGPSVEEHERKFFKNKTVRVNNWYDAQKFYPLAAEESKEGLREKLRIPQDAIVMTSVGACLQQKNHKHIIQAFQNLASRYPRLFYLHLGEGILCIEEQTLVSSFGLGEHTSFAGNVNNVREHLVASDIYIMPSDYEGLSISLLECMACGIPAIGYDVPGVRDLIKNDKTGYLVPRSIDRLTSALEDLISNEKKRFTFGKQSVTFVQNEYNMAGSVDRFVSIYQGMKL